MPDATLAPNVPADYYRRILEAEQSNFWYQEMRRISRILLGDRMRAGARVLDAGCGTGGFLRFLIDEGDVRAAAGVDIAEAGIAIARERVPEADLRVAPLRELPFPEGEFDLVVSNDVLQHVPEDDEHASLLEVRRVLASGGTFLLRTNGSRRLRRERYDWRAYDRGSLEGALGNAGFAIERATYANMLLSLAGAARGRVPHAPSEDRHGIPTATPGTFRSFAGRLALRAEEAWLARGRSLPYGHTLFAVTRRT